MLKWEGRDLHDLAAPRPIVQQLGAEALDQEAKGKVTTVMSRLMARRPGARSHHAALDAARPRGEVFLEPYTHPPVPCPKTRPAPEPGPGWRCACPPARLARAQAGLSPVVIAPPARRPEGIFTV